jgi:REP element-mobilizing transposase RayT
MGNSKCSSGDAVQMEWWQKRKARPGKRLGRKRSKDSGVTHSRRPGLAGRIPVHITMKLAAGLPSLREQGAFMVLLSCFRASNAESGLRIIHFSVQSNHVHMICEAADEQAVSSAMQGLGVRIARRLNGHWKRKGTVFADRYHREDLTTPSQVRHAIRYVLQNVFRHSSRARFLSSDQPDEFSSGQWFTGWKEAHLNGRARDAEDPPVVSPRVWLLTTGWKRHGLLSITERPASAA